MAAISIIERVKLNYAICTIVSIILYTFALSTFTAYLSKLYAHVLYFILAESIKLTIIQKVYNLDVSYSQDGIKKRRSNKFGESIKFAMLMIMTCFCYAFIAIIMGGKLTNNKRREISQGLSLQHRHWRTMKKLSRCLLFSPG